MAVSFKPKIGDYLVVTNNSAWLGTYKIIKIFESGNVQVMHSSYGNGAFIPFYELVIPKDVYESPLFKALQENDEK